MCTKSWIPQPPRRIWSSQHLVHTCRRFRQAPPAASTGGAPVECAASRRPRQGHRRALQPCTPPQPGDWTDLARCQFTGTATSLQQRTARRQRWHASSSPSRPATRLSACRAVARAPRRTSDRRKSALLGSASHSADARFHVKTALNRAGIETNRVHGEWTGEPAPLPPPGRARARGRRVRASRNAAAAPRLGARREQARRARLPVGARSSRPVLADDCATIPRRRRPLWTTLTTRTSSTTRRRAHRSPSSRATLPTTPTSAARSRCARRRLQAHAHKAAMPCAATYDGSAPPRLRRVVVRELLELTFDAHARATSHGCRPARTRRSVRCYRGPTRSSMTTRAAPSSTRSRRSCWRMRYISTTPAAAASSCGRRCAGRRRDGGAARRVPSQHGRARRRLEGSARRPPR